jgi:hypothetical protein
MSRTHVFLVYEWLVVLNSFFAVHFFWGYLFWGTCARCNYDYSQFRMKIQIESDKALYHTVSF